MAKIKLKSPNDIPSMTLPRFKSIPLQFGLNISEDMVVALNPQGVIGPKYPDVLNGGGTSLGGQISLSNELAKMLGRKKGTKSFIVGQQVSNEDPPFSGEFNESMEPMSDAWVLRFPIAPDGKYVDKEEVKDGDNAFYPMLRAWGMRLAQHFQQLGEVPGKIILHYWDSVLTYQTMLKEWAQAGLKKFPIAMYMPHSLGVKKFKALLSKAISDHEVTTVGEFKHKAIELLEDRRYLFPLRLLIETGAMQGEFGVQSVVTNSEDEIKQSKSPISRALASQFMPTRTESAIRNYVVEPGINSEIFNIEATPTTSVNAIKAESLLNEMKNVDIDPSRFDKPWIVMYGRINKDKNQLGLAQAFAQSQELREKFNLLMVLPSKDGERVNPVKDPSKLKGTQEQVEYIEKIKAVLDKDGINGSWTIYPSTNQPMVGGPLHLLGREGRAGSGSIGIMPSLAEAYGLVPFEIALNGIPVAIAKTAGCLKEFGTAVESFNPLEIDDIARALLDTAKNHSEIRAKQLAIAKKKSWESEDINQKYHASLMPDASQPSKALSKEDMFFVGTTSTEILDKAKKVILDVLLDANTSPFRDFLKSQKTELA